MFLRQANCVGELTRIERVRELIGLSREYLVTGAMFIQYGFDNVRIAERSVRPFGLNPLAESRRQILAEVERIATFMPKDVHSGDVIGVRPGDADQQALLIKTYALHRKLQMNELDRFHVS